MFIVLIQLLLITVIMGIVTYSLEFVHVMKGIKGLIAL